MKALPGILTACCILNATFLTTQATGSEAPSPYEQPKLRSATIYEANSNQKKILYKFTRSVTRSGSVAKVVREFSYPDGKVAARERIVYTGDNLLSYELEELQINVRSGALFSRDRKNPAKGQIDFSHVADIGSSSKTNFNTETLRPDTLVGDMTTVFVAAHWDELMKGKSVKCRLVATARAETFGFMFQKHAEKTWQGKPAVVIKLSPSSFIINALVNPLYFTMEKDGEHRILQCDGLTTPKIKSGNKWKDLEAETVFDWD